MGKGLPATSNECSAREAADGENDEIILHYMQCFHHQFERAIFLRIISVQGNNAGLASPAHTVYGFVFEELCAENLVALKTWKLCVAHTTSFATVATAEMSAKQNELGARAECA